MDWGSKDMMNYSFRLGIILISILAFIATTTVLYTLHQRTERNIVEEVEKQRNELAGAISVARYSISNNRPLREFLKWANESFLI